MNKFASNRPSSSTTSSRMYPNSAGGASGGGGPRYSSPPPGDEYPSTSNRFSTQFSAQFHEDPLPSSAMEANIHPAGRSNAAAAGSGVPKSTTFFSKYSETETDYVHIKGSILLEMKTVAMLFDEQDLSCDICRQNLSIDHCHFFIGSQTKRWIKTIPPLVPQANKTCANCNAQQQGTTASDGGGLIRLFELCGECRSVYYCSRQCQIEHWKQHQNRCLNQKLPNRMPTSQSGRGEEFSVKNNRNDANIDVGYGSGSPKPVSNTAMFQNRDIEINDGERKKYGQTNSIPNVESKTRSRSFVPNSRVQCEQMMPNERDPTPSNASRNYRSNERYESLPTQSPTADVDYQQRTKPSFGLKSPQHQQEVPSFSREKPQPEPRDPKLKQYFKQPPKVLNNPEPYDDEQPFQLKPLKVGVEYDLLPLYVEDTVDKKRVEFYASYKEYVAAICKQLANEIDRARPVLDCESVKEGRVYFVLFEDSWYRAVIKRITANQLFVLYVDFGNAQYVPKTEVSSKFRLATENFELKILPAAAFKLIIRSIVNMQQYEFVAEHINNAINESNNLKMLVTYHNIDLDSYTVEVINE